MLVVIDKIIFRLLIRNKIQNQEYILLLKIMYFFQ